MVRCHSERAAPSATRSRLRSYPRGPSGHRPGSAAAKGRRSLEAPPFGESPTHWLSERPIPSRNHVITLYRSSGTRGSILLFAPDLASHPVQRETRGDQAARGATSCGSCPFPRCSECNARPWRGAVGRSEATRPQDCRRATTAMNRATAPIPTVMSGAQFCPNSFCTACSNRSTSSPAA